MMRGTGTGPALADRPDLILFPVLGDIVPEYWIVDLDSRLVERWRPEDTRPAAAPGAIVLRSERRRIGGIGQAVPSAYCAPLRPNPPR